MGNFIDKGLNVFVLQQKTKDELIEMVVELQSKHQKLFHDYLNLSNSIRENNKKHSEELEKYQKQMDKFMELGVSSQLMMEEYKKIVDLKLGNTFNPKATWIDKIIFVLKEAGRPLRSSEIIEILRKNKCLYGMTDPQKGLSAYLTKALKYGRIIGEKQKGQNGYIFRLPE